MQYHSPVRPLPRHVSCGSPHSPVSSPSCQNDSFSESSFPYVEHSHSDRLVIDTPILGYVCVCGCALPHIRYWKFCMRCTPTWTGTVFDRRGNSKVPTTRSTLMILFSTYRSVLTAFLPTHPWRAGVSICVLFQPTLPEQEFYAEEVEVSDITDLRWLNTVFNYPGQMFSR